MHVLHGTESHSCNCVGQVVDVEDHDVGLTIEFVPEGCRPGTEDCVTIQDLIRVKKESNAYRCPCAGTLQMTLDNTYSMLRGKTVSVRVSVGPHVPRTSYCTQFTVVFVARAGDVARGSSGAGDSLHVGLARRCDNE